MQPTEIIQTLKSKGWKLSQIARAAKVSSVTLSKIEGGADCRYKTVRSLMELLDTPLPVTSRRSAKAILRLIVNASTLDEAVALAKSGL